MSIELKIKSKHLGVEAQIIRFEERKLKKQVRWFITDHKATGANDEVKLHTFTPFNTYRSLNRHRRWDVRNENRATFLARAYLAGKSYSSVEHKRKPENEFTFYAYVLPRVVAMVAKYGPSKLPLKIYDRTKSAYIDNPELATLKKQLEAWTTNEVTKA
jgi:hypothetical protein